MFKRGCAVLLVIVASACGEGQSTPSAPSITQVNGVWMGTLTQRSTEDLIENDPYDVTRGSECLAFSNSPSVHPTPSPLQ